MNIQTKERAFPHVINTLRQKGFKVKDITYYNKGRHCLIKTDCANYYVLCKHDFFYSFNKQFPQYVEENRSGFGDSINAYYLKIANKAQAWILFVYDDGKIYLIHPKKVKELDLKRTQDKANEYLLPNFSKSIQQVNEVTYSFPLCKLKRFD